MGSQKHLTNLFRELLSTIRTLSTNAFHDQVPVYKQCYGYRYIYSFAQSKRKIDNKAEIKELYYIGNTYLCLLQSVKDGKVLYHRYKGSGEQDVQTIAGRVGFRLPKFSK